MKYGVYAFVVDDEIRYIGSTRLYLSRLEYNHRNAWKLGYTMTRFRQALETVERGKGSFKWLVERYECGQEEIETLEGEAIRLHNPTYNVDKDPVRSSKRYGRY
jgi:hypothetical protein